MRAEPTVLALFGPTAVGKTALAIAIADRLRERGDDPVAISVDALQVYAGLETLTGLASAEEQRRLEHRLVSFVPLTQAYSVAEHARHAHREIDAALAAGRTPIAVGGTGLYLRAALADLTLQPPPPAELRASLTERLHRHGPQALHEELSARAPAVAARIAPTDAHRVVRALELHELGETHGRHANDQLWTSHTRRPTRLIGLTMDREALDERIDRRVDDMLDHGATDEVRAADARGASQTARKALGFAELLAAANGELTPREAADAMKRRTRRYARRQLTWMRKLPDVELVDLTGRTPGEVAGELVGDR